MPARSIPRILLFALLIAANAAAAAESEPATGADLSYLARMLSLGAEYREDGAPVDPHALFRARGYDIVRLRLWHTPPEPWHALDSTLAAAHRFEGAGFDLLLDFHYSDGWADPGQQTKPAAWAALDSAALVDSIRAYTAAVVARFRDEGILPRYLQIGNEIGGGFLWDDGRVGWPGSVWDTPERWSAFTALLGAAIDGARAGAAPDDPPEILIHIAEGGDVERCRWFFDNLIAAGTDFDGIAFSFYPWWHGTLADAGAALHDAAARYGKPVWIIETSYPWTLEDFDGDGNFVSSSDQLHPGDDATPEGQLAFLRRLRAVVRGVPGGLGAGVLVWEPAFLAVVGGPSNPNDNLTLFDSDGDALPGLDFAAPWDSSPHDRVQVIGDWNGWDPDAPDMSQTEPGLWFDTLLVEAGCHLLKFRTDGAWDDPLDYGSCDGEHPGCVVPPAGSLCPAAHAGTALGRIEFPSTGSYVFRLDERECSYRIAPIEETAAPDGEGARRTGWLRVEPNPASDRATIRFFLNRRETVRLAVYDAAGRRVALLAEGSLDAGVHDRVWDGRNGAGRDAAAGVYFVRLIHGSGERLGRLVFRRG
ncbi:MAG: glycosyl hydrolase 53 family protein [Candidatus Eisenbacteria bacterium]|nr:glycosyl hydrolase 53 family protein [Candidatus Eisenbacteria bacterium]